MTRRPIRLLAAASATALALVACDVDDGPGDLSGGSLDEYDLSGASYVVGSKDFTEQLVLGYIAMYALEAAGASTGDQVGLAGSSAVREALVADQVDVYWEYDGTAWGVFLGQSLEPDDIPDDLYSAVAEMDLEENGIVWFEPAPYENVYALAVRSEDFDRVGVEKLSDLPAFIEEHPEEASICLEAEFAARDDGLPGLEAFYGTEFPAENITLVDTGVVYIATDAGRCTFGEVFGSDGRILALDLTLIEDDGGFFPPYFPSATMREEAVEQAPEVADLFAEVAAALDLESMQELNARVDVEGEFAEDVALDWLRTEGFVGGG